MKKYTLPQLKYLTEWLVRNANEMTEEWKKKNELFIIEQKAKNRTEEDDEKIKSILSWVKL